MGNTENNTPKIDTEELQKSVSQTMKITDLPEEIQKGLAEALTGKINTENVQAAIARTQDGIASAEENATAGEEKTERADTTESVIDNAAANTDEISEKMKEAAEEAKRSVEELKQETEEAVEKAKTDLRSVIEELEKKTKEAEDAHVRAAAAAGVEEPGIFSGGEMKTAGDLEEIDFEELAPADAVTDAEPKTEAATPASAQTSVSAEEATSKSKDISKKQDEMAARVAQAMKEGKKETAEARKGGFLHRALPFLLLPLAAVICGLLYFTLRAGHEDITAPEPTSEEAALSEIPEGTLTIPTNAPLEKNADNDLNAFFRRYYDALTNYNEDTLKNSNPALEKADLVRMHAISEYVTGYPVVDVYTKPGPTPDSYVAYVYTRVKYDGYAKEVPGMQTMYMVKDENGNFYINNNSDDEDVNTYIRRISIQDDVLTLNKQVEEEYNALLKENNNLDSFMADLQSAIEVKIGNLLAIESGHNIGEVEVEGGTTEEGAEAETVEGEETEDGEPAEGAEGEEETATEDADAGAENAGETAETAGSAPSHAKARAKEAVRVRKTAEDGADYYGVVYPGYDLDVTAENGEWLTVTFEGETGYVKAQYFELHD